MNALMRSKVALVTGTGPAQYQWESARRRTGETGQDVCRRNKEKPAVQHQNGGASGLGTAFRATTFPFNWIGC
jgi:hypothetical protein